MERTPVLHVNERFRGAAHMEDVISPAPAKGGGRNELPAYLSNGVVGLRVRNNPLIAGMALLSGFSGQHAVRRIEAAALIPYPLAGDICLDGVWLSEAPQNVRIIDQACDFATGELTSRLAFSVESRQAQVEILTFCSRDHPTIVCQEISVDVDGACEVCVTGKIDLFGLEGRSLRHDRETPARTALGAIC